MHRKPIESPALDQRIFMRTARRVKKINVAPKVQRGGIRL